ncbi:DUF58 domain-containing protein [Sphingomonas oleivorans]|uniref:DUF58 domain-containing protein n=1 Tax=Sphingomonas oleivorans TaxID=1735121 RepID=A0A2T5FVF5_9SPHN|nr:DUF58 domain-containing protein [Sphingomonas oleivorans]PTQ09429.1 DUF58 domain-containing protein [Sphingomonas oleivorans]
MIYPSGRAILLAAAGAPVALLLAVLLPSLWYLGVGWTLFVAGLMVADALLAPRAGTAKIRVEVPGHIGVGAALPATIHVAFPADRAPATVEVALAVSPLLEVAASAPLTIADGMGAVSIELVAVRRGTAMIEQIWLRWRGTLGLAWTQRTLAPSSRIIVTPDIRPVQQTAAALFQRSTMQGLLAQRHRGDGAEFEALADFRPGMDKRSIDWKQSARHRRLLAKEYRPERNNNIVFALDAGRTMCEPVAGLPRIDRAVSAALVSAYVALKLGDRVSLFGFDARPRLASGAVAGTRSFGALQRLAASLDYTTNETNYTLALTTLDGHLDRRSMVVLFTEFTDATSAELMIRALGGLIERHLVIFVMLNDAELEDVVAAEPQDAADVARAVTAADLLRERRLVMSRLVHAGVHVIEARHDRVAVRLVDYYLELKRRNQL